jgi:hypothetical protein
MITMTLTPPVAASTAVSRTTAAIKSLMSLYEQGEGIVDDEDDVELMILLSGMVGGEPLRFETE